MPPTKGRDSIGEPPELPSHIVALLERVHERRRATNLDKEALPPPSNPLCMDGRLQDYFIALYRANEEGIWQDPMIDDALLTHIQQCSLCFMIIVLDAPDRLARVRNQLYLNPAANEQFQISLRPDSLFGFATLPQYAAARFELAAQIGGSEEGAVKYKSVIVRRWRRAAELLEHDPLHRRLFQFRRKLYQFYDEKKFQLFRFDPDAQWAFFQQMSCLNHLLPQERENLRLLYDRIWHGDRFPDEVSKSAELTVTIEHVETCLTCRKLLSCNPEMLMKWKFTAETRKERGETGAEKIAAQAVEGKLGWLWEASEVQRTVARFGPTMSAMLGLSQDNPAKKPH